MEVGTGDSAKLEARELWESIFHPKLRGGCFSRAQWRKGALAKPGPPRGKRRERRRFDV